MVSSFLPAFLSGLIGTNCVAFGSNDHSVFPTTLRDGYLLHLAEVCSTKEESNEAKMRPDNFTTDVVVLRFRVLLSRLSQRKPG